MGWEWHASDETKAFPVIAKNIPNHVDDLAYAVALENTSLDSVDITAESDFTIANSDFDIDFLDPGTNVTEILTAAPRKNELPPLPFRYYI